MAIGVLCCVCVCVSSLYFPQFILSFMICFNSSYMPNYFNCRRILTTEKKTRTQRQLICSLLSLEFMNSIQTFVASVFFWLSLSLLPLLFHSSSLYSFFSILSLSRSLTHTRTPSYSRPSVLLHLES